MQDRLAKVRGEIAAGGLDGLLITENVNIRYLSGFTGSYAVLLITGDTAFLLTDTRYVEQADEEVPGFAVEMVEDGWITGVAGLVQRLDARRVGFEGTALNYEDWKSLREALPGRELVSVDDLVGRLRMVKDASEVAIMREAARIADLTCEHILRMLKPGLREREVAVEIDYFMRKQGADKEAFGTIVASGPRSALPHGEPTDRIISAGEFIVLDFGARKQGYHSDITRTVLLGRPKPRQQQVYNVVLEAQQRAIAAARPGLLGREVDAVAREYIAERSYGKHFGHGLGHGLGLAVHEGRILAKRSEIALEPGMVVTVEPGIYISGWGGVRIEDDVLVTESGHDVLTHSPRVLTIE